MHGKYISAEQQKKLNYSNLTGITIVAFVCIIFKYMPCKTLVDNCIFSKALSYDNLLEIVWSNDLD